MKNFKNLFIIMALLTLLVGCESDDVKYSGTPVGNQDIETLESTITTTTTVAMLNQLIPIKVNIPRPFNDTVFVEVSTLNLSGSRIRTSIQFLPGQVEAIDEVACAGGLIFDTTVRLSVTGISVQTPDPGKHFLMKSNVIELRTGNTPVPPIDNSRLSVRLAWPDASNTRNNLRLDVVRPVGTSVVPLGVSPVSALSKTFSILTSTPPVALGTNQFSSQVGEYFFRVSATRLTQTPMDLRYRFVARYPDGKTEIFEGVLEGLTTSSAAETLLKVTKSVDPDNGKAIFVVTDQNL